MKNLRIKLWALIGTELFYLVLFSFCSIKALPEVEHSRFKDAETFHEREILGRPIAETNSKPIAPFTLSDQLMKGYGHDSFIELPPKKISTPSRAASMNVTPMEGHDRGDSTGYDVWTANCHTATNNCIMNDNTHTGALICGGHPEKQWEPAHHTACWRVTEGKTCVFNWGQKRCFNNTKMPPDINNPETLAAAKWACFFGTSKDQFTADGWDGNTRFLPVGQTVEQPGYIACILEVKKSELPIFSKQGSCVQCCSTRIQTWLDQWNKHKIPGDPQTFKSRCEEFCKGYFR